jgi:hypothetical protein
MTTYFETLFNRPEYNKTFNSMSDCIKEIEKRLNEDRVIVEAIVEKDKKTDRVVTVYKPEFSAKLMWTEIPKYEGVTLVQ